MGGEGLFLNDVMSLQQCPGDKHRMQLHIHKCLSSLISSSSTPFKERQGKYGNGTHNLLSFVRVDEHAV